MKKLIFSFLIILTFSFELMAQEEHSIRRMGGGGFMIGYGNLDVSKLQEFVPGEVRNFRNDQVLIGGTGHAFIDRFVIGGSGFGIIGDAIKTDSLKMSVGGGLGTFDVGYLAVNRDHMKIFPLLGIGGGGYGVSIAKNKNISTADIAKNPGREINTNVGGFVIDASINVNLIPVLLYDEKDDSYGGFMTGMKIGYVYGFPSSDWNFSGGDVTGGPNFGISMFYVKLIFGGFGFNNGNKGK